MPPRTAAAAHLLTTAAALLLAVAGHAAAAERVVAGRYLLRASAKIDATGLPAREQTSDVLALVGPGDGPEAVRMRLAARGYDCDLTGALNDAGELALEPGQTCPLVMDAPDVRGRVEATLRSGRGSLRGGELALELAWSLSGAVRTKVSGERVRVLGTTVDVPHAWTPDVPIRGTAETAARGRREDRSSSGPAATGRRSP